jgi:hypothetical protein
MCFSHDNGLARASVRGGTAVIKMPGGLEIRFPIARNPRLAQGNDAQLNNIEVSPFGLHWPDLDEDLSFAGLCAGDYGQNTAALQASGTHA